MPQANPNPHALHCDLLVALMSNDWTEARRLADELCLVGRDSGWRLPPQCSVGASRWEDAPTPLWSRLVMVDNLAGLVSPKTTYNLHDCTAEDIGMMPRAELDELFEYAADLEDRDSRWGAVARECANEVSMREEYHQRF